MIDASLVETPFRPAGVASERAAVDPDAALTARKDRRGTHYGYKRHVGVDQGSRLIRKLTLTPATINDTVPADHLVCGDEQAVYADKAYAKRARSAWPRAARKIEFRNDPRAGEGDRPQGGRGVSPHRGIST